MSHIRGTSLKAYREIEDELGERQKQVYDKLIEIGLATNTMISRALNLPINSITPRIFELRQKKLVGVGDIGTCPITKRTATFWKVVKYKNGKRI